MFGRTFLGTWRGGDVAVKCVRVGKESEASSFLREVACLAAIRHPNVMQFFGKDFPLRYCQFERFNLCGEYYLAAPERCQLSVVMISGACLQPPEQCWLLCEYLPGGTLSQWLHGDRKQGGRSVLCPSPGSTQMLGEHCKPARSALTSVLDKSVTPGVQKVQSCIQSVLLVGIFQPDTGVHG